MRVLQRVARGRQFAYLAGLTVLVTLLSAVGVLFFDRGVEGATIRTFGDALWWAAAMVTTINNEAYAVSPEARLVALLLRVFAVSVFGLVTAAVASYFVGQQAEERAGAATGRHRGWRGFGRAAPRARTAPARGGRVAAGGRTAGGQ
jgi:voltage-gated potassium channel